MKRKWVGGKEDNGKFDIEFQISELKLELHKRGIGNFYLFFSPFPCV